MHPHPPVTGVSTDTNTHTQPHKTDVALPPPLSLTSVSERSISIYIHRYLYVDVYTPLKLTYIRYIHTHEDTCVLVYIQTYMVLCIDPYM